MPAVINQNGVPVQVGVNATTGVRLEDASNNPRTGSYLWLTASAGVTSGEVYVEVSSDASVADGAALGTAYYTVPVSAMPYPIEIRTYGAIALHGDGSFNVQVALR